MANLLLSATLLVLFLAAASASLALAADDAASLPAAEGSYVSYNVDEPGKGPALPHFSQLAVASIGSGLEPAARAKCIAVLSTKDACVLNSIGPGGSGRVSKDCCLILLEEKEEFRRCFRHFFIAEASIALEKAIEQCGGEVSPRKLLQA